jgi:hypothetical protein
MVFIVLLRLFVFHARSALCDRHAHGVHCVLSVRHAFGIVVLSMFTMFLMLHVLSDHHVLSVIVLVVFAMLLVFIALNFVLLLIFVMFLEL